MLPSRHDESDPGFAAAARRLMEDDDALLLLRMLEPKVEELWKILNE